MLLVSLMLPDLHGKNGWPARLLPVSLDMALTANRLNSFSHPIDDIPLAVEPSRFQNQQLAKHRARATKRGLQVRNDCKLKLANMAVGSPPVKTTLIYYGVWLVLSSPNMMPLPPSHCHSCCSRRPWSS